VSVRLVAVVVFAAVATGAVVAASAGADPSSRAPKAEAGVAHRFCRVDLMNDTGRFIPVTRIDEALSGTWRARPPHRLKARRLPHSDHTVVDSFGHANIWESRSGFARGCWSVVAYGDNVGTIKVTVVNPYSGANRYRCKATGVYRCAGPMRKGWMGVDRSLAQNDGSRLTGRHLRVIYYVCSTLRRPPPGVRYNRTCG
jgi:hypothetical protein